MGINGNALPAGVKLPEGVTKADLKYGRGVEGSLELVLTDRFGWCIATLLIRGGGRRYARAALDGGARTYAVSIATGELCSVGMGPHVKARVQVWVTKDNAKRLRPLLDARDKGTADANSYRDRLSTSRMRRRTRTLAW